MVLSRWSRQVPQQIAGLCRTCQRSYVSDVARQSLSSRSELIRPTGNPPVQGLEDDFALYPGFFNLDETRDLLAGALYKLDKSDPTRKRRRKGHQHAREAVSSALLQDLFSGPYGFAEGHYDSVIHEYRESTMSSLPSSITYPNMAKLLNKAYALLPGSPQVSNEILPSETITHLLHLAPSGKILGHVDNLEASGRVIMGICLGSDRILRLSKKDEGGQGWDVLLRNGTVYLQRDRMRYEYEHAILGYDESTWEGTLLEPGHRLSIMVRDAPKRRA